jgi:multicomponent K+:H+ antiporter subunit A
VPFTLTRLLFPAMLLVAVYLLLRGHDQPGGGFSAGMVVAIAILVQYMIGGADWTERRLSLLRPVAWIGTGLVVAAGTGFAAMLFGRPFLTTYFAYADLPVIGKVPVASALAFDIGVFVLVVGATLLMLVALAHQSVRAHRASPRPVPGED